MAKQRRAAAEARWWSVTNAGLLTATDLDPVDSGSRSLTRVLGQVLPGTSRGVFCAVVLVSAKRVTHPPGRWVRDRAVMRWVRG